MPEYMGSYGSHPRYKVLWGTWGSLKVAITYLEGVLLYNLQPTQATGPGRWKLHST
jgi:hypothetical protein